jgi:neural Wiskott-Aldrich syndrome protein
MNDHSAGYAELPRTAYLDHTLRRARTVAEQRSHRYVTPEHLLLALVDDPDAVELLSAVNADIAMIRAAVADTVNHRMAALAVPDGRPPSFSYKFDTLFLNASEDALRAGRREVDGGLALIAVAKDPESRASAILAANGFHWQTALHTLGTAARPQPPLYNAAPQRGGPMPPPPQTSPPAAPLQSPRAAASDNLMEDMLASVRNILEAEERKERGLPPDSGPAPRQAPPPERAGPPRREPQFGAGTGREGLRAGAGDRAGVSYHAQEPASSIPRGGPAAGPALLPQDWHLAGAARGHEFPDSLAVSFDRGSRQQQPDKKGKGRSRGEPPSSLAKLLQNVPRNARAGVPETVRVQLTKEEAAFLLARASRRGQPQLGPEGQPICRAVAIRLTAPEGGFFIEPSEPETQWIVDRPAFLGADAFGNWAWTVLPNETGSYILALSISARDMNENGGLGDLQFPEQTIKVRIRGNLARTIWAVIRTVLLLLAGSGLTAGAWYALKIMGKLPH